MPHHKTGPAYKATDYAGFLRRTAALVIDGTILFTSRFLALWGWYSLAPRSWVTVTAYGRIELLWVAFAVVYLIGCRLTTSGTPGYRIVGIRYAYMLDGRPHWTALAFRAVAALGLSCFFALNHIWIIFDPHRQAWHDKITGFYVVKRNAKPSGTVQVVRRLVNFMMLTFVVWEPLKDEDRGAPAAQHAG